MHLREEDKMNREIKFTKEDFEKLKEFTPPFFFSK